MAKNEKTGTYHPWQDGKKWCVGGNKKHGHFCGEDEVYVSPKGRIMCKLHRRFVRHRSVYQQRKKNGVENNGLS